MLLRLRSGHFYIRHQLGLRVGILHPVNAPVHVQHLAALHRQHPAEDAFCEASSEHNDIVFWCYFLHRGSIRVGYRYEWLFDRCRSRRDGMVLLIPGGQRTLEVPPVLVRGATKGPSTPPTASSTLLHVSIIDIDET